MMTFLLLMFAFTLFYLSMVGRFRVFSVLIGLQGLLLFFISFIQLNQINLPNLLFITTETLLVKGIAVPWLLFRIIKKTGIYRVHPSTIPGFYSLLMTLGGLIISLVLGMILKGEQIDSLFITIGLLALISGIILIVTRKRIFSHLVGFLVIENAVFLFSLAVGTEIPMMVNIGILLDIVVSVLILSVFVGRIGEKFNDIETESLTDLKH